MLPRGAEAGTPVLASGQAREERGVYSHFCEGISIRGGRLFILHMFRGSISYLFAVLWRSSQCDDQRPQHRVTAQVSTPKHITLIAG